MVGTVQAILYIFFLILTAILWRNGGRRKSRNFPKFPQLENELIQVDPQVHDLSMILQIKEIIITTSSILPELLIQHINLWKTPIWLGNFQEVQKFVRKEKFFWKNQETVGYSVGNSERKGKMPNSSVHYSVQLNRTKHKIKWMWTSQCCFLFGATDFYLIGQENRPLSILLPDGSS